MKNYLLPILLASFYITIAQTPCVGGMAGVYPCSGYDLQSEFSLNDLNASSGNDSWGWTDPNDGKEYALIGVDNGTAFIDISDPVNPVFLGKLPTHTSSSLWRDIKTYNNYAFIVSEANGHGMQIFDLTRLRNVANPPVTFTEDAHYSGFGNAHNLVINENTGFAYGVGTDTYSGGSHFVNIQDPLNPTAAGGYSGDGFTHDAQVVTYIGPDTDYTGHEIYIGSNGSSQEVVIVDVTDKSNPQNIAIINYSNAGYTHQGWLTEDHRYFLLGDEFDENNEGFNSRTIILDFTDLDNPQVDFEYFGQTPAIDHNGYVKCNEFYLSNYKAGIRVIDIGDIANGNMSELGYFDSYPTNNNTGYDGAWNVYPYFRSGNIVISDLSRGFLLVKSSASDTIDPIAVCQNINVQLDQDGQIIVSANDVDGGSSDNSCFFTLELNPNTFDCSDLGANTVTLTVTDPSGNTDTCTTTIMIEDDLAPLLTCPSNSSVAYDSGEDFYTLPDYASIGDVTAIDNCTSNVTILQNPAPGTQLTIGTYTISFETTDDENNTSNCSFELIVVEILSNGDFEFNDGLSIYPNPTSNSITINSKNASISNITIFNISGKLLFSEVNINSETKSIDISYFSKGIYFVSINNQIIKKIIKR